MSTSEELLPPPFAEIEEMPTQFDRPTEAKAAEETKSKEQPSESPKEKSTPPLPEEWIATTKSKREVPQAAKVAGGGILLLLMLVFFAPECGGGDSDSTRTSMIVDTDVEAAEHLKKRRHLTDVDFAAAPSRRRRAPRTAPAAPETEAIDLAERQRLRNDNPEDIRKGAAKGRSNKVRRLSQSRMSNRESNTESMLEFYNHDEYRPTADKASPTRKRKTTTTLLPAATQVKIQLTSDLTIRNGRTTVIATVGEGQKLPKGTKLIGSASADRDGLVSIRFRTVVLPTGESLRARAEAIDDSGSMALLGTVSGGTKSSRGSGSVARSVGTSTAQSAASTVLGSGLLGRAVDQTVSKGTRGSTSYDRSPTVVRLGSSVDLFALFVDELRHKAMVKD